MIDALRSQLGLLDALAFLWFVVCWFGYGFIAEHSQLGLRGLVRETHHIRLAWARQMLDREIRVADAALLGNLMSSVSFYANTTIYIIAGMFAVLGTLDKLVSVTADLPFAHATSRDLIEFKLLLLIAAFVFAYFKFTWSLRQMNLLSILMGGAPHSKDLDASEIDRHARRIARVNSYGGDEFNRGIRAYYFGLAALCWLVSPALFLIMTTIVVGVLYRRDFASPTLRALRE